MHNRSSPWHALTYACSSTDLTVRLSAGMCKISAQCHQTVTAQCHVHRVDAATSSPSVDGSHFLVSGMPVPAANYAADMLQVSMLLTQHSNSRHARLHAAWPHSHTAWPQIAACFSPLHCSSTPPADPLWIRQGHTHAQCASVQLHWGGFTARTLHKPLDAALQSLMQPTPTAWHQLCKTCCAQLHKKYSSSAFTHSLSLLVADGKHFCMPAGKDDGRNCDHLGPP